MGAARAPKQWARRTKDVLITMLIRLLHYPIRFKDLLFDLRVALLHKS
jgi:hypothetical protein